jgi:hypothetical protein
VRDLDHDGFRYGIESELALIDPSGRWVDWATPFEQLDAMIDELPTFESDYPSLRVGDLGIKAKRWYIEGYERFTDDGRYLRTEPKGLEVRTPICTSIVGAVDTLGADVRTLNDSVRRHGHRLVGGSLHPFARAYRPDPPLNDWERANRSTPEERTAPVHMLTYGPDVNLSHPELGDDDLIDIGRKLTYYSPYLVPFSFSSPWWCGAAWGGLSRRTYYRTGARPAALVFLHDAERVVRTFPSLTEAPRLPAEAGRIEFKAFDGTHHPDRFACYLALIKGMVLDRTLTGRAWTPNAAQHRMVAREGFESRAVRAGCAQVLVAALRALGPADRELLRPLADELRARHTPAHRMLACYEQTRDIIATVEEICAL